MKKSIPLFLLLLVYQNSNAQVKEICITLDDLPVVSYDYKGIEFQRSVIDKLVSTFNEYNIPAIGFVNENKLYAHGVVDAEKVTLLKSWLDAGYELGNHTFSHKDYHKVPFDEFARDVLDGEKICKPLLISYNQEYNYFRHPYLHIGLNKSKHDSLVNFLTKHGYTEAPVSIDNDDYIFAYAYNKAMLAGDEVLMVKIGTDYVNYMEEKLLFFQGQSEKLLGRNVKHILLLHANAINADYLDELAERYQSHGYAFISMKKALEDEAYKTEISKYNDWGISWIDAIPSGVSSPRLMAARMVSSAQP